VPLPVYYLWPPLVLLVVATSLLRSSASDVLPSAARPARLQYLFAHSNSTSVAQRTVPAIMALGTQHAAGV